MKEELIIEKYLDTHGLNGKFKYIMYLNTHEDELIEISEEVYKSITNDDGRINSDKLLVMLFKDKLIK